MLSNSSRIQRSNANASCLTAIFHIFHLRRSENCKTAANPPNSAAILSPPLTLFALLSAATFLLLLVLFWRNKQSAYKRRHSQWERSFLCQRRGTLTEQE